MANAISTAEPRVEQVLEDPGGEAVGFARHPVGAVEDEAERVADQIGQERPVVVRISASYRCTFGSQQWLGPVVARVSRPRSGLFERHPALRLEQGSAVEPFGEDDGGGHRGDQDRQGPNGSHIRRRR